MIQALPVPVLTPFPQVLQVFLGGGLAVAHLVGIPFPVLMKILYDPKAYMSTRHSVILLRCLAKNVILFQYAELTYYGVLAYGSQHDK